MSDSLTVGSGTHSAQQIFISFPAKTCGNLPSMVANLVSQLDLNLLTRLSPSFSQFLWHNPAVALKLHLSTTATSISLMISFLVHLHLPLLLSFPSTPPISLQAFAEPVGLNNDKCALDLRLWLSACWEFGGGPHTHLIYNLRHWNQSDC